MFGCGIWVVDLGFVVGFELGVLVGLGLVLILVWVWGGWLGF